MARKPGSVPGDVVRYVPATEPLVAAGAIAILTLIEVVFSILFLALLFGRTLGIPEGGSIPWFVSLGEEKNSVEVQQMEAFFLGAALLTLAMILSIYRKFFLPDVMIVKKRKLKYEDLM